MIVSPEIRMVVEGTVPSCCGISRAAVRFSGIQIIIPYSEPSFLSKQNKEAGYGFVALRMLCSPMPNDGEKREIREDTICF